MKFHTKNKKASKYSKKQPYVMGSSPIYRTKQEIQKPQRFLDFFFYSLTFCV